MADTVRRLEDALHDEVDEQERLIEESQAIVERVKARLGKMIDEVDDFEDALAAAVVAVEDELTDLTTKAVRRGIELAQGRPAR